MKILIVDDKEEERYLSETLLKGSGYEVVTAVNGAEALEKLRIEDFDMIVSDVLMPVMDGVRFCRECRGDEKLKDIPFVFYTATYKDERDEELALKVGADKYILKPIEPEEFIKIIQGVFRDMKEGKIGPKKPVLEEEKEVLKLYSERLIAKLEKKMLELEAEIAQRQQAEEEVKHLNRVLHTIRSVNQLMVKEKEQDKLLKSACAIFIKNRNYDNTCICLFDESGMLVAHAEAGLGKDFLPMVERLKRGELTDCIKRTLIQSDVVITEASSLTCGDCPLVKTCSSTKVVTVRIEHGGKVYGLLRLSLSGDASISSEEQSLLQEVTGDIAFGLHDIELEEEHKRAEEQLQIAEQNFRNSLDSSPLGIRIVTAEGKLLYANQAILDVYGSGSVEELKAMPAKQRYTPESYAEHQERKERRKLGKPVPSSYEISIVRKDGEVRHLIVSRKEVMWGGETQFQALYQDITERKRAEHTLNERVKELQCLYGIASIAERPGITLDELYQEVVNMFPAGWQYPEITCSKITIDDKEFRTNNYRDSKWKLSTDIKIHDAKIGKVEANYLEERPKLDEGPFLKEERLLIDAVAERLGKITERQQAEEALRESEQRYQDLFDSTYDMIQSAALDGHFFFVNKAWRQTLGYTEAEISDLNLFKIIHPESLSHCQELFSKVIAGESIRNVEVTFIAKDGRLIQLEGNATPRFIGGKVIGTQGFFHDITERKQAEEMMRGSEEKYRQLFELGSDALFLIEVKTGKILDLNNAAIEMYGYSREEALQMKNTDFSVEPDKTRKATLESEKHIPVRYHRRKDGTIFPTDISVAYYTWYGKEVCVAAIRDTTERKKAVDDLKRAAEEWRTTFDSITDLVFITDKDYKLVRVNKAFADVVKMKPEELIGRPCYEMIHGTNKPVPNCPYKETIKTKKPATAEFFEPHLGMHLEVATSPIFNDKGEVVASVHLIRDITERRKMEEQLIVTDRLASIGELSSGIAHELNNPLTSVIGFSELLLDKDVPDDVKEDLKVINREAQRTAGIVRNLLIFARKHDTEKKPVNINSIIEKVLELRAYEQRVSNIQVNTQFAPDLPEITADDFRLQQVFLNIIINAEYFMTEAHGRGTLTITTERVGDIVRASFADDGPGIAEENLGHLFDPFFTTKEVGKGTGLGLSICHGIISEQGGRIYAESKLGKGATFVVELPISQ